MNETCAFIIPAVSLFVWMILSSIEFGASVFRCFPTILKKPGAVSAYMSPVWEATNVFLVYFITGMFSFFPGINARFGTDLLLPVFTGLVFMGMRVTAMLLILYGEVRSKAVDLLLLAGSFLAPVTLSLVFIYMLTGAWTPYLVSPLSLALAGTVVGAILMISSSFFRYFADEGGNKKLGLMVSVSAALTLFCFALFGLALADAAPYLFDAPGSVITLFMLLAIPSIIIFEADNHGHTLVAFLAACGIVGVMYFTLFAYHLPYLIYPDHTVTNSVTNPAAFGFMAIASVVGLALILPALWLLYRMFAVKGGGGHAPPRH